MIPFVFVWDVNVYEIMRELFHGDALCMFLDADNTSMWHDEAATRRGVRRCSEVLLSVSGDMPKFCRVQVRMWRNSVQT